MSDFKIGQKVVYVGNTPRCGNGLRARKDVGGRPKKGEVYEVRWIGMAPFGMPDGTIKSLPACRVVGVCRVTQHPDVLSDLQYDVPYGQAGFRPVEEQINEASIEVFRKIARDVTAGKVIEIVGD